MCQSVCLFLSVWWSVRRVYCDKTADWIWMQFRMLSVVGRGMGVLHGVEIVEGGRGSFGDNVAHPIVTNRDFVA